jgi:hypothetical protein
MKRAEPLGSALFCRLLIKRNGLNKLFHHLSTAGIIQPLVFDTANQMKAEAR